MAADPGRAPSWRSWAMVCLFLGAVDPSPAQQAQADPFSGLLQRSGLGPYANYAEYPYRPYQQQLRQDVAYSYFGDFLADGFHAFRLEEERPGNSLIAKDEAFRSLFNNLVIASNSYGRVNAAVTVGDEIRTVLTPMTMQRAGLNGLRWEMTFPNNRLTLVAARGFDNTDFPGYESFSSPVRIVSVENWDSNRQTIRRESNPVYTIGGHWQTQVGDVVTLGATVLNQHQMNAGTDKQDGFLSGGIPYTRMQAPYTLVLCIADDSPDDATTGAAVFSVGLELQGTAAGIDTVLSSLPGSPHYDPRLVPVRSGGRRVSGHWVVTGEDSLLYTFSIPAGITARGARFTVVVANDYRVAAAQWHVFGGQQRMTPYTTLIRASGEIGDYSNRRRVVLDYGLNSGQTLYGLDFQADLVGLKIRGEVTRNALYRRFPVQDGAAVTERTTGWYVNVAKTFPGVPNLVLGAELFRVGARYGGGYDSRRGGVVLYTDEGGAGGDAVTAEYPLVEDNDDRDRYADDNANDYPGAASLDAGVYPGLDLNRDNIPDDDQNANGVPDYEESFLLFSSDPQEFVYGLDLNNNNVIDVRENDNKPDYPYDRDRKGYHLTLAFQPRAGMELRSGHYRVHRLTGAERAVSSYVALSGQYEAPRWGTVQLNHDSKRVRDDIPDPVYVYNPQDPPTPIDLPSADPLLQQDSWVHTSFVGTQLTRVPHLRFTNNAKLLYNLVHDRDATPADEADRRSTVTMVNKVEARWAWGPFSVRPMYKRMWQRETLRSRYRPLLEQVQSAPILRLDYRLNDGLSLQFGQQGLRLGRVERNLAYRFIDRLQPSASYSTTDTILMLTLQGDYLGNTITTNSGIHWQHKRYDDPLAGKDERLTRFFVDVVAGFQRY